MSGAAAKWREDQILVICPGSRTTMAQLGCNELTPPVHRIPTRMFRDPEDGGWRPYHTFKRKKAKSGPSGVQDQTQQNGDAKAEAGAEEEWEWVEDKDSEEGAVYPMQAGLIVNMPAFLAFLDHIHSTLTTTYHNTPIVLVASPQWTRDTVEDVTQYVFEKTKTPALCLIHSAIATQYGLRWPSMTVVDIGFEKVDVTCIGEGAVVSHGALGVPYGDSEAIMSGGEVFTRRLHALLEGKGFSYDMAEKLKRSNICEVLPYSPDLPGHVDLPKEDPDALPAPGTVAADPVKVAEGAARQPAALDEEDRAPGDEDSVVGADGVLDVASIVTSGQTKEFLARAKEKGKGAGRKGKGQGQDQESQAARTARLPNSKRMRNVFQYEEVVQEEVPKEKPAPPPVAVPAAVVPPEAAAAGPENGTANPAEKADGEVKTEEAPAQVDGDAMKVDTPEPTQSDKPKEEAPAPGPAALDAPAAAPAAASAAASAAGPTAAAAAPASPTVPAPAAAPAADEPVEMELRAKLVRRDIEVGTERFLFAEREQIDRITTLIWKTVQAIPDMYLRPACWDNIAIVGNGSRVRGLRENIIQTLTARHLISPSSATMFTSELPSNMATPTGTGSQTPTGSFTGAPHQLPTIGGATSSGVNPLLQAATTATLNLGAGAAVAPSDAGHGAAAGTSHKFHSQTPTSIRLAPLPTYLQEWNKNGYEEAVFLGAQVAGRIAFCLNIDAQSVEMQKKMSFSRVEYNDMGPKGIRKYSMLQ